MSSHRPEQENEPKPRPKRGEIIAICSAKGGIGRTTLAVNLAVALSKKNIQICLMDGDFQFGDVSLALDIQPTFTIKDIIEYMDGMDAFSLAGYLNRHSSGVKVLAAPERPEFADMITGELVLKACDLLLTQHDFLIVDTGAGLHDRTLELIEKADHVLLMTTLEIASIQNTKMMMETLETLGMRHKIQVVMNRSTMDSVIKAGEVPDILGEESPIFIPHDGNLVTQSLNIGIPFVMNQGKSDIAKAVFKLAEQLISRREIAMFKPKQPSFLQSIYYKIKPLKEKIE